MADLLSQEEMNDMGLEPEQVNVLKKCFDGFADEDGAIPADNVGNILSMMGLKVKPSALKDIIEEIDEDGKSGFFLRLGNIMSPTNGFAGYLSLEKKSEFREKCIGYT